MNEVWPSKSLGSKVISTKLSREEFTRFQYYCKSTGETINGALRRLVLYEIDNPQPSRIAGRSEIEYNRGKDNFNWRIRWDDGSTTEIDSDLPSSSLEQLSDSIKKGIDARNSFIRRQTRASVTIPRNLTKAKS